MTVKSREIELVSSRLGYLKRDETRTILSRLILNNRDEQDETAKRSNEDRPPVPDIKLHLYNKGLKGRMLSDDIRDPLVESIQS